MTNHFRSFIAIAILTLSASSAAFGDDAVVHITTNDSLTELGQRLSTDTKIREVIFAAGVYHANMSFEALKDVDPAKHPLLIRAADGAEVVFDGSDGSAPMEKAKPHDRHPGVFAIDYVQVGGEYPKLWEPSNRIRYRLVADSETVARFPATYTVEGKRLLLHPSDGQPPAKGRVLISHAYLDYALFINRPHVTVRGLKFRNFLAQEMWSTAIQLRGSQITVEDCVASNCSLGFTVSGNNCIVRRCTAEDVGGGIYVGGENMTIENCRLLKRRDAFMVPMYAQDDSAIQFYYPGKDGVIRGNLCVGFRAGIFLKTHSAPYVIEHNTIDGSGQGIGFGATKWKEGERFRYNIIVNCARELDNFPLLKEGEKRDIDFNCYWSPTRNDLKPIGANDVVADPKLVWPAWGDYRLANNSPVLTLADQSGPAGAFAVIGKATLDLGPPREWHVSETGRDTGEGTAAQPVKTIQFAVDRAKPGDTILVHPGVYRDPVVITRGGTAERPLVIRAVEKWRAILDSNREAAVMISVTGSPWVEIRDLEIRWYSRDGIEVKKSPNVTVAGCRIWNAHWYGAWPTGRAVDVDDSPGFVGTGNVLFRQEYGFFFMRSPGLKLTHNTCIANLYAGAALFHSSENSICRYNNLVFQGSDPLHVQEGKGQSAKLKTFDCDYNNYGNSIGQAPKDTPFDTVKPRKQDAFLDSGGKSVVFYTEHGGESKRFVTFEAWRKFSGLDEHSIFADPLFVNAAERDLRLEPGTPNAIAQKHGRMIGACEIVPPAK